MKTVALAGGVGGAKLAQGLQSALPPGDLTVVVNSADDFDLWGLRICPDLDTVMYTLAGLANPETGWGVRDETFAALSMLETYGEDPWFKLGDRDLATHILRTQRLRSGEDLTSVIRALAGSLGVASPIMPPCNEPVATEIETVGGPLDFQEYFVRRGQRDEVIGVRLRGIEEARVTDAVLDALSVAEAIILCPSNPIVSIEPILAVPGMREAFAASAAPKVAVSPIVGGRALKGPAAEMLRTMGHEVSALGVASMYAGLIDGFVMDHADKVDAAAVASLGMSARVADAVMCGEPDRQRLAQEILTFCAGLA